MSVSGAAPGPLHALPLLAAAGFASMVSMRVCDAMLPALAQAFEASPGAAASVISAYAIAYGILQLLYGPLGDRFGKLRVIGFATLACSAVSLAAALAPGLDALVASRALAGAAAAGIIPMAMAWIGDQVPYAQRQEVLARLLGATVLGTIAGTWAGGLLADTLGWRSAFVALALLFGGAGIALRGELRPAAAPQAGAAPDFGRQVRAVLALPAARWLYAVVFVEGALVFGSLAFIPSHLHARFGLTLGAAGGVVALYGVGGLFYSRLAGRLLRRVGADGLAVGGGGALCAGFGLLALAPAWGWAVPACLVIGLGFYMLHNTLQTRATQLHAAARGTAVSLFACALFFGQSAGILLGGWCVERGLARWLFGLSAPALLALGAAVAAQLRTRAMHEAAP